MTQNDADILEQDPFLTAVRDQLIARLETHLAPILAELTQVHDVIHERLADINDQLLTIAADVIDLQGQVHELSPRTRRPADLGTGHDQARMWTCVEVYLRELLQPLSYAVFDADMPFDIDGIHYLSLTHLNTWLQFRFPGFPWGTQRLRGLLAHKGWQHVRYSMQDGRGRVQRKRVWCSPVH